MNNNWLRNTIRSFEPYVVPEIKEHIVINANESPYNIFDFPQVKADFLERLAKTPSYHYPDPFAEELRAALAKYVGCQPQEVLVSNGGDEIISLIMNTFLNPGDTLLTHTPTFDIYGIDAEVLGAQVVTISDLDGYRRDRDGLLTKVKELQPKVTVLCNPNNPTGELLPLDYVESLVPDGPAMVKALHDADICVRSYKAANLKNCLRITITTDEVVRKVVAVMTEEAKKNA